MKIKLIILCCFVFNAFAMNQKIKMPCADLLRARLNSLESCFRPSSTASQQLVNALANKEMEPIAVAQEIKIALAPYHKGMERRYSLNYANERAYGILAREEFDTKDRIYEAVFADFPEALAELKAHGHTDIPAEPK